MIYTENKKSVEIILICGKKQLSKKTFAKD